MRWRNVVLLAVLLGCAAKPVTAQFGIPQVVFDPQANASLRLQYVQLARQAATAISQLRRAEQTVQTLQDAARRYRRLPLANFVSRQTAFERLFSGTAGLGYNNPSLDRIFRSAFPESRVADPIHGASAAQQNLVRRAAYALVMGTGQQGVQLREAVQTLESVKQMTGAASSQSEIAQAQAAAGVLAVQEAQQARQLQVASVNQQAAMDAYRISRDAREDSLSALARARWDVRERQIAELIGVWRRRHEAPVGLWRLGARPVLTAPVVPAPGRTAPAPVHPLNRTDGVEPQ